MLSPQEILKQYWGYDSFRSKQEDAIHSILDAKDTLTLLPTGGGKSICFQVPALMMEGICIVISPLIALMNDQVTALKAKNIRALAITSGMSFSELDIALDNCIYGNYKFLYLSPERLESDMVQQRLKKMNINLIAVDEAHCISEWGYNFRPSYLKIAEIREITTAPILALTATATPLVVKDIQEKLKFDYEHVISTSFYRDELSYVVLKQDDKDSKLIQILNRVKGTSIVYCRTRKETKRIHLLLSEYGITSHYYNAGLDVLERASKQKQWQLNHVRVMVATNAFGMGIDKNDVRLVIHNHLPFSLEAYFQEAGRAGRDRKLAYSILLYNDLDIHNLKKQINDHYPEIEIVRNVYQQIANYLGIAIGDGKHQEFPFHINEFCERYNLNQLQTYNVLKLLEKEDYIKLSEAIHQPSRLFIKVTHTELYQFQIANKQYDILLKILLRSYGSLFDNFTKIQENIIAKRAQLSTQEVKDFLTNLKQMDILDYIPQNSNPKLLMLKARVDSKYISLSKETLETRKANEEAKAASVIQYASNQYQCRSHVLQNYFGEKDNNRCGKCDVCLERNKLNINDQEFEAIMLAIQNLISQSPMHVDDIIMAIVEYREDKMVSVLQFLSDNGQIAMNDEQKLYWIY
ncbi:MAG: RecQ family ATP-dependent DNA helicase [Flavobacteriales bacterium]|nr:RecQ family ATP-dependent DNA helicase [Flavobacteriales bacterium]